MPARAHEAFRENARTFGVYGDSLADVFHKLADVLSELREPSLVTGNLEDPILLATNISHNFEDERESPYYLTAIISGLDLS